MSKASFDEWTDWFPNNEALDQKQRKYLADIKAKHEWRFTVRNERKVRGLVRLGQARVAAARVGVAMAKSGISRKEGLPAGIICA